MRQSHAGEDLIAYAMQYAEREDWPTCRHFLEMALAQPAQRQAARFLLWEVCQALHDPAAGILHLRHAAKDNPLRSRLCLNPSRRVLAISVVGDFQANLPVDMLLSSETTELHTLWLETSPPYLVHRPRILPDVDCAFIAIAEDARHLGVLLAAEAFARTLNVPIINSAAGIAAASRARVSEALQGLANTVVPLQRLASPAQLRAQGIDFPIVIRPRYSHAGKDLACLHNPEELDEYLQQMGGREEFYVAPFIDYRDPDGQWRKYRIIFVDGVPWPFHMAVHHDWAIWYYNAGMGHDPAKRAEEARFLSNIESVFPPCAMGALRTIADRVGLDYFGLDCGLLGDGSVLVFEIETGMIVHDRDPEDLYPYKKECVGRIFRAVENMIDARVAEWRLRVPTE